MKLLILFITINLFSSDNQNNNHVVQGATPIVQVEKLRMQAIKYLFDQVYKESSNENLESVAQFLRSNSEVLYDIKSGIKNIHPFNFKLDPRYEHSFVNWDMIGSQGIWKVRPKDTEKWMFIIQCDLIRYGTLTSIMNKNISNYPKKFDYVDLDVPVFISRSGNNNFSKHQVLPNVISTCRSSKPEIRYDVLKVNGNLNGQNVSLSGIRIGDESTKKVLTILRLPHNCIPDSILEIAQNTLLIWNNEKVYFVNYSDTKILKFAEHSKLQAAPFLSFDGMYTGIIEEDQISFFENQNPFDKAAFVINEPCYIATFLPNNKDFIFICTTYDIGYLYSIYQNKKIFYFTLPKNSQIISFAYSSKNNLYAKGKNDFDFFSIQIPELTASQFLGFNLIIRRIHELLEIERLTKLADAYLDI